MRFRILPLAFLLAAPAAADGWLPEAATLTAGTIDRHFTFLLVVAAMTIFLLFFAIDILIFANLRRDPDQVGKANSGGGFYRGLVIAVPSMLSLALVAIGVQGYVDASIAPTDALTIEAHGGEGGWSFRYSEDVETDALHVPAERPVRLALHAEDSPLSLAIPEFRVRQNARAHVTTEAWFEAERAGEFTLLATGSSLGRSTGLASTVTVYPPAEFDGWLESKSDVLLTLPPVEAGRVLVERKGCLVCHSVDGSRLTGPSFQALIGRTSPLTDGTTVIADAAYVRQSILESTSQVVEGYQPVMPSFAGQIRDAEIDAIIIYLESLSDTGEAN